MITAPMTTASITARPVRRRSTLGLLAHQIRYEQLSFYRNPQSAVFTFIFPVVFITLIGALFGGVTKSPYFGGRSALGYYVPTIAALSVLGSCYGQLAVALAARRQNGILKRARATPLPAWAYFAGLLVHCVLVSVVDIVLIVGVGRLYGLPLPAQWPAIALTLVLGAASFCALGVAVASVIANAEAPGRGPAGAVPAAVPVRHLHAHHLRDPEPDHLLAPGAPVQPGPAGLVRSARRAGLAAPGRAAGLGRVGSLVAIRRFRWNPRPE